MNYSFYYYLQFLPSSFSQKNQYSSIHAGIQLNVACFYLTIRVMVRILSSLINLNLPESPSGKHIISLLPPATRFRIQALRNSEDISRSLTAYSLLFRFLHNTFGADHQDVVLTEGPFGKPELAVPEGIFFNCAHAGMWALCAISRYPVGVDIEEIGRSVDNSLYAYLHPKEIEYLEQLPCDLHDKEFLNLWTLKESYLKALGCGLLRDTASFAVVCTQEKKAYVEDPSFLPGRVPRLEQHNDIPGYAVAACSMIPDSGEEL